ncbi:MAG: hypothetical protein ACRCTZ_10755 [Sarcina sp.]
MDIKKIIIFLIIIYLINKILEFILKKSEKVKEQSKRKITMPALNLLSLYSYDDFKKLVKYYLEEHEFEIKDEDGEFIYALNDTSEYLIYCKQVKEYTDKVTKEDFYIFISELNSKYLTQGIILSNGDLEGDIKLKIEQGIRERDIKYVEGNEFVKKLRKIKEQKLYKGEL